jgi:hypothetical protein
MEKTTHSTKESATVSTSHDPKYEPKIYMGGAGICFLAETLAIDAQMQMKDDVNAMQIESSNVMMKSALGSATAQENAGSEEADALMQNANSQFASIASSAAQVCTSTTALVHEARVAGVSNKMSSLSDEVQNHKLTTTSSQGVGDFNVASPNESKLAEYKDLLINAKKGGRGLGSETYESITKRAELESKASGIHVSPLDVEIKEGEALTLRQVLNSSDDANLSLMKAGMKKEVGSFDDHVESKRRNFESKKSIVEQAVQASVLGAQANFKATESTDASQKASDTAISTMQQTLSQQFGSDASRKADASNQAFQTAQSHWSTLSQMVQVETRA